MKAQKPTIHLILGCFGLCEDNFISCPSVENTILSINSVFVSYTDMMTFLDQYGLFDNPCLDSNGIKNILASFRDKFNKFDERFWNESKINQIYRFIQNHKLCGLFLKISTEISNSKIIEKRIEINPLISSNNLKIKKMKILKGK